MGNLDFLEKKTKYAIGWDGILEGKETFTNKGFNNDDPADTWCKISEYFPKEGSFVNTVGPISSAHGFDYDLSIANCHDAIVSRFLSDKYETISIKFDIGTIIVVHCDIDKCTIPGRSNIQYNSITFPTEGWWIKATMNGVNPVGALGVLMTISTSPRFMFSGKGFTSPNKPYRYVSRSVKPDDDICVWINEARIPESIDEEFVKGFNAICNPNDFDSIAEIKLDENLANICKHAARQCLAIRIKNRGGTDYYYYHMEVGASSDDAFIYYNATYAAKGPDNNKVSGLYIEFGGSPVYFNPNVTSDEYDEWYDKYIATEP